MNNRPAEKFRQFLDELVFAYLGVVHNLLLITI